MGNDDMSLDGIWAFEIAGIYGWERVSTVYLEKGRYLGGGAFIYSKGSYVTKGKKIKINLQVTQHGEMRAKKPDRCGSNRTFHIFLR